MDTRLISQGDVARIVRALGRTTLMDRVIERLAEGLTELGRDKGELSPARDGFVRDYPTPGVLEWMPHHVSGDSITIKTVAYSPMNPQRYGLPTILGNMARYDSTTGRLVAIADGVLLTAMRTGAASAVASRLLADPGSAVLGVIGAGAQAVTQVHALSRVLPLERVLVWDVNPRHAAGLADRTAFLGLPTEVTPPEAILARADVMCTVTSVAAGADPVVPYGPHKPHLHVNAVGSDLVGKTELPLSLLLKAFVTPDHPAQALLEGECQQLVGRPAMEEVVGPSLGELCAAPEAAAGLRGRLTVFDSTGFALEDHIALDVLLEAADEVGAGSRVRIEYHPDDALDPYSAPAPASALPAPSVQEVR
ncbi:alanine dehydrogenase [Sphaerisporangium melleum]|uniref:Alanine dehydrogenase n=1 Tax=Sphaerisporangium melleum TaxID=321316 RepID=A0A917QZX7_9ACTN|nr:ornithine cyclodeaminase family protein [Sphaerisporangium melleum]GGK78125.1 alanine dehydrogenase [Sphaerisporangium melleum]GII71936.1 alanine dehydrogenase [Sphaerisporangium melleum]